MNTNGDDKTADSTDAPVAAAPTPEPAYCANCGAQLHGPYCHDCGQPVRGMVRPLSSMLSDVADTIFNIDSRIFGTLIPLYWRPGYLTNEYFAGRRTRYVTPFRLYFFLSVAAFLLMQVGLDNTFKTMPLRIDTNDSISAAKTPKEVIAKRDKALAELDTAQNMPFVPNSAMNKAAAEIRTQADARLAELNQKAASPAPNTTVAASPKQKSNDQEIRIDGELWNPRAHPVHVGWLPGYFGERLNEAMIRAHDNLSKIKENPRPFLIGAFGALPGVLFVLMPLFALMLKIFYIFKRRLYMEHLIVALHSHSFIFLSLLLLTLIAMLRGWTRAAAPWLDYLLGLVVFVMSWWLPIYLLIMQKRVYRQGWFLTILKYCTIGIGYTILIGFGIAAAFVVSLATT